MARTDAVKRFGVRVYKIRKVLAATGLAGATMIAVVYGWSEDPVAPMFRTELGADDPFVAPVGLEHLTLPLAAVDDPWLCWKCDGGFDDGGYRPPLDPQPRFDWTRPDIPIMPLPAERGYPDNLLPAAHAPVDEKAPGRDWRWWIWQQYYRGADLSLYSPGIPEPATWMMLILGFGAIAGMMRSATWAWRV